MNKSWEHRKVKVSMTCEMRLAFVIFVFLWLSYCCSNCLWNDDIIFEI